MGGNKVVDILAICQKLKILYTLKFLLTLRTMGLEISKCLTPPTVFIQSGPNFMINQTVIRECKVMDILMICQE